MVREHYVPPGERQQLEREVETCDQALIVAQSNGDVQKQLEQLEKGLYLRRKLYPEASPEISEACHQLCQACNLCATQMLQRGNMRAVRDLLTRAEEVAHKNELDQAMTYNNKACYYRKMKKLRTAVAYLERALAIEEHSKKADAVQTHLNMCATLSESGKHVDALYHAQRALLGSYELLAPMLISGKLNLASAGTAGTEGYEQVTVHCIAYHNLAVEHEYLKNFGDAICAYAEGSRWASGFLESGHQLIGILQDGTEAVKAKLPAGCNAVKHATQLSSLEWAPLRSEGLANGGGGAASVSSNLEQLMTPRDRDSSDEHWGRSGPLTNFSAGGPIPTSVGPESPKISPSSNHQPLNKEMSNSLNDFDVETSPSGDKQPSLSKDVTYGTDQFDVEESEPYSDDEGN